jgi:hypothetical protein
VQCWSHLPAQCIAPHTQYFGCMGATIRCLTIGCGASIVAFRLDWLPTLSNKLKHKRTDAASQRLSVTPTTCHKSLDGQWLGHWPSPTLHQ